MQIAPGVARTAVVYTVVMYSPFICGSARYNAFPPPIGWLQNAPTGTKATPRHAHARQAKSRVNAFASDVDRGEEAGIGLGGWNGDALPGQI